MEKDAQSADRYKADVYSMAKLFGLFLRGTSSLLVANI